MSSSTVGMSCTKEQKMRVYQACIDCNLIRGSECNMRNTKGMHELLESRRDEIPCFFPELTSDQVVGIIKYLLVKRVFASKAAAREEFPDIPDNERGNEVCEALGPASKNWRERRKSDIPQFPAFNFNIDTLGKETTGSDEGYLTASERISNGSQGCLKDNPFIAASPAKQILVPFKAQHDILTKAQQILEQACFEFGQKWLPDVINRQNWDCPEAVELTNWTGLLLNRADKLPHEALRLRGKQLRDLLKNKIRNLRNTAVHRLQLRADGIDRHLIAAKDFAQILNADFHALQIEELREALNNEIQAMEMNRAVTDDAISLELDNIRLQREELQRREDALIQRSCSFHSNIAKTLCENISNKIEGINGAGNDRAGGQSQILDDKDVIMAENDAVNTQKGCIRTPMKFLGDGFSKFVDCMI